MEQYVEPRIPPVTTPSRYRWHPSIFYSWPCQINSSKGCHLFQQRVPKIHRFLQCWQSTWKMKQVAQPTLKINYIGRYLMRDPGDMATIPKNAAKQRPYNVQSYLETSSTFILCKDLGKPLVATATPCGFWIDAQNILSNIHSST